MSSEKIHAAGIIVVLVQVSWSLLVLPDISRVIFEFVIPPNVVLGRARGGWVRVAIDLHQLSVITHDKRDVVEGFRCLESIDSVVMDTSEGLVPWLVVTGGANHLERHELGNETCRWIHLHDDGLRVSLAEHDEVVIGVHLAARDCGDSKRDIVEELAPPPVAIKINSICKSMIIGSGGVVLR